MIDVKRPAALAALLLAAVSPVLAGEAKPPDSQESHSLRLNDIMVDMQLRHFKLWRAGIQQNWPLASYELAQIRASIEDISKTYQKSEPSNMSVMSPMADQLEEAIKAKNPVKFTTAFGKLTASCNACHEATGFGFIKMREPKLSPIETSPLTDEDFSGK
jgi:hypothetical protein